MNRIGESRPFSNRAFFRRDCQFVQELVHLVASASAGWVRTMFVSQKWTRLTNRKSFIDLFLSPHRHSSQCPFGHRFREVPATNQQGRHRIGYGCDFHYWQWRERWSQSPESVSAIAVHVRDRNVRVFTATNLLDLLRQLITFRHRRIIVCHRIIAHSSTVLPLPAVPSCDQ